jgi:hypothetical protein
MTWAHDLKSHEWMPVLGRLLPIRPPSVLVKSDANDWLRSTSALNCAAVGAFALRSGSHRPIFLRATIKSQKQQSPHKAGFVGAS